MLPNRQGVLPPARLRVALLIKRKMFFTDDRGGTQISGVTGKLTSKEYRRSSCMTSTLVAECCAICQKMSGFRVKTN